MHSSHPGHILESRCSFRRSSDIKCVLHFVHVCNIVCLSDVIAFTSSCSLATGLPSSINLIGLTFDHCIMLLNGTIAGNNMVQYNISKSLRIHYSPAATIMPTIAVD